MRPCPPGTRRGRGRRRCQAADQGWRVAAGRRRIGGLGGDGALGDQPAQGLCGQHSSCHRVPPLGRQIRNRPHCRLAGGRLFDGRAGEISNSRPPAPQTDALTRLRYGPTRGDTYRYSGPGQAGKRMRRSACAAFGTSGHQRAQRGQAAGKRGDRLRAWASGSRRQGPDQTGESGIVAQGGLWRGGAVRPRARAGEGSNSGRPGWAGGGVPASRLRGASGRLDIGDRTKPASRPRRGGHRRRRHLVSIVAPAGQIVQTDRIRPTGPPHGARPDRAGSSARRGWSALRHATAA